MADDDVAAVRRESLAVLAMSRDQSALPAALRALRHPAAFTRSGAVDVLVALRAPEALPPLREAYRSESPFKVKRKMRWAIGVLETPRSSDLGAGVDRPARE